MEIRPRVGIIAPFWPPDYMDNAGALLVRHRVNALQDACDVTLIVQEGWDASPYDLGVRPEVRLVSLRTPRPRGVAGRALAFGLRSLAGELTPGGAVLRSWSSQLREEAPSLDVVEVHWSQHFAMVDSLRQLYPRGLLLAYAHDVMTQALHRRAVGSPSTLRRWMARISSVRAAVREPLLLNKFDSVATFSSKDAALLSGLGVRVPIGVEQLYFDLPRIVAPLEGSMVVFVGAMYRPENDQAAKWLVSEIWPAVRDAVPDAELLIAGSGASAELQESAAKEKGVRVVGYVRDLAPVYLGAAVVLVPLIVGAGIKLKVIEALACGVPVIATPVGAEGLAPSLFAGISEKRDELARLTVNTLLDRDARARQGAAGRAWADAAHRKLQLDIDSAVRRYRLAATGGTACGASN